MDGVERSVGPLRLDQILLAEFVQGEVDGAVGVNAALHVSIDVGLRSFFGCLRKLIAMRTGGADDQAGNDRIECAVSNTDC